MSTTADAAPPETPGWRVVATLLFVQVMFGGFHVAAKAVLAVMDPLLLTALRAGLATPLLLAIAWRHDRRLPGVRELPTLALLGLLGVFANQLLFVFGLARTTATNASILQPSIPVFALAVGALLGIDRPSRRRLAGVLVSVAGAVVMLRPWALSFAGGTVLGNLLILGNCVSYAAFLVVQRPILGRLPWRTVVAWSFLFGTVGILAVAAPDLASFVPGGLAPAAWAGIGYIVLFPTVLGYALSTWAVRRSTPTLVAAFTTLQPLFAAALAVPLLGESVGWEEAVGFLLIVGGLALATRRRPAAVAPGPT